MNSLKETASRLLADSELINRLRPFGEPYLHGSYDLDLMVWPEIDVFLGMEGPNLARAFQVISALAEGLVLRDVHLINQVDHAPRFAMKDMILLDLSTEFEGIEWKLDIGLLSLNALATCKKYNATLKPKLTPEIARTIVDIKTRSLASKHYRRHNWKYIKAGDWFFSGDIYRAVAFNAVGSFEQFTDFLRSTKGVDISEL